MKKIFLSITILIVTIIPTIFFTTKDTDYEDYIRENISTISEVKPVLGGKWYVVSLDFSQNDIEVVYEDGHIQEQMTLNKFRLFYNVFLDKYFK